MWWRVRGNGIRGRLGWVPAVPPDMARQDLARPHRLWPVSWVTVPTCAPDTIFFPSRIVIRYLEKERLGAENGSSNKMRVAKESEDDNLFLICKTKRMLIVRPRARQWSTGVFLPELYRLGGMETALPFLYFMAWIPTGSGSVQVNPVKRCKSLTVVGSHGW